MNNTLINQTLTVSLENNSTHSIYTDLGRSADINEIMFVFSNKKWQNV